MGAKSIWVTGSRGFIGRRIVAELKETGTMVRCFSNQPVAAEEPGSQDHPCYELDYLNVGAIQETVRQFGVPDVFIHAGWGGMATPEAPIHLEENVKAGQTLIRTLFEQGLKRFMFIGSMNEYGARSGQLSEHMAAEGRLTNYAKGKIEVAKFGFQTANDLDKTFIHVRTFYVFGAGQRPGSLINQLYQAHRAGTEVNLSACEHYRDYVHVSEVAEGVRLLSGIEESTTVNLGSGKVVQVKDFVLLFWRLLGGDEKQLKFGARTVRGDEPEQPRSYADLTRLKKLVDWVPSLSLEEGLRRTILELKEMDHSPGKKINGY